MSWNPFIELARDPVGTLSTLGYALGLAALIVWTLGLCWSNVITLIGRWRQERPRHWEYVPPVDWLVRAGAVPAILALDAWAAAAVVWILT